MKIINKYIKQCLSCSKDFVQTGTRHLYCLSCANNNARERSRKSGIKYYKNNKKLCDKRNKLYQKLHPEERKKANDKWRKNNTYKQSWYNIKRRCIRKNIELTMTKNQFYNWYLKQQKICVYCKINKETWKKTNDSLAKSFKVLQIDRKNSKLGYTLNNIVLACPRCNLTKSDFFSYKQMLKLGELVNANHKHI